MLDCAGTSSRGEDSGSSVVDAFGEGICCIFLELGPLLNGFLLVLDRLSGDGSCGGGLGSCFRRPITVPSRLRPKPPLRCSWTLLTVSTD